MGPFLILSTALRYPDRSVLDDRAEVRDAAAALPDSPAMRTLLGFLDWWTTAPRDEVQRQYSETFDFSKRACLDLTFATHGDRRQRGLALLKLRQRYAAAGMELVGPELPDHLPVLLEFVDACPEEGGRLLAEYRPVIELLRIGLAGSASPYRAVVEALCKTMPALSDEEADEVRRMAAEGPPDERVGLEPFAPPEVMPGPVRPSAACAPVRRIA
ncbi:MAG: nitrate reductase molybdenum cofactor assembly chaperone [Thermoleophilia bacterium]|nr:nitrate reductase molybdenum cofactor assembly chaperone [Thermoleophilia bacterium]